MAERQTRGELADTLFDLRKATGLSGPDVAARTDISQASVSRFENGKRVPSSEDVVELCELYGAAPAVRRRLQQLAADLKENTAPRARIVMDRGAGTMQQRIGRIESSSAVVRNYYPSLVPGLLQTAAYARAVFASEGTMPADQQAKALAGRMERARVLDDVGRRFVFVLTEGVLRWPLGGPAVMVSQLDHIVEVSKRGNVAVGVVPWTRPVDVAPVHGFDLLDERAVIVGTLVATSFITDAGDVEAFVRQFALIEAAAVFSDDARALIAAAASGYRSLL